MSTPSPEAISGSLSPFDPSLFSLYGVMFAITCVPQRAPGFALELTGGALFQVFQGQAESTYDLSAWMLYDSLGERGPFFLCRQNEALRTILAITCSARQS